MLKFPFFSCSRCLVLLLFHLFWCVCVCMVCLLCNIYCAFACHWLFSEWKKLAKTGHKEIAYNTRQFLFAGKKRSWYFSQYSMYEEKYYKQPCTLKRKGKPYSTHTEYKKKTADKVELSTSVFRFQVYSRDNFNFICHGEESCATCSVQLAPFLPICH